MRLLLLAIALAALALPATAQTGALDPTFGTDGRVVFDPFGTLQSGAADVAVLPDGRILLAGRIGPDAAFARLSEAGALDPSFGQEGTVNLYLGDKAQGVLTSVSVLPDGSALASGGALDESGTPTGAVVVRILANGFLDLPFGVNGVAREGTSAASLFATAAVQPDGRIVAIGQSERDGDSRFVAVRYLASGRRDVSYGTGGFASPSGIAGVAVSGSGAAAVDAQGRLVGVGIASVPGSVFDTEIRAFRLTVAGTLDASFGTGGVAVAPLPAAFNVGNAVAIDAQGRIVVGGGAVDFASGSAALILLRYTEAGALDASFGEGGVVRVSSFGPAAIAFDLALQSDGRILAGGTAGPGNAGDFLLARFTEAGALDTAFGTGGRTTVEFGVDDTGAALAFASEGRVVIAGQTGDATGTQTRFAVARFITDGRPVSADAAPDARLGVALSVAPNPFASTSLLRLTLADATEARITLTDALGRTVAVLHDGALGAGAHMFRLDGARLAAGVYVVRAETPGGSALVRLVRR